MSSNSSTKVSPVDIKTKEFRRVMLGYDPKEVVEYLEQLAKTFEKQQKQERELFDKIQSLNDEVIRWRGKENEIQKQRERLQAEAQETRERALAESQKIYAEVEQKASEIRHKTEAWLERVLTEVEETERRRNNFVTAFRSALDSHYELLKKEEAPWEPLGNHLGSLLKDGTGTSSNSH